MKYLDQESVTQTAENKDMNKTEELPPKTNINEEENKNKGREAEIKTRRSRDGTWTKKNDVLFFDYKLLMLVSGKSSMKINYLVTTVIRAQVKEMLMCLAHNLHILLSMKKLEKNKK